MANDTRLFVLYCEEDDSHTTLDESDLICEPSVQVGDSVTFFCGRKAPWDGVVKAIGDDIMEMNRIRDNLNASKPNRQGSFHADRKRRTAMKARSTLTQQLCPASRTSGQKKTSKEMTNAEKTYLSKLRNSLINYSGESGGSDATNATQHGSDSAGVDERQDMSEDEQEEPFKPQPKHRSVLSKALESSDDSDGSGTEKNLINEKDDRNDSSSSDEALTAEELAALEKVARKRKVSDINQLIALSKKNSSASQSKKPKEVLTSQTPASNPSAGTSQKSRKESSSQHSTHNSTKPNAGKAAQVFRALGFPNLSEPTASASLPPNRSEATASASLPPNRSEATASASLSPNRSEARGSTSPSPKRSEATGSTNPPKPMRRSRYAPRYTKKVFNGEYFLHKADDPGVEKLWPSYEVYVLSDDLSGIRRKASSGKEIARLLVSKIFTPQAIDECSVTGRPASGRGKDNATLRPPLDANGVAAIIEFAKSRAKKKKWSEVSATEVKKSMSNVLVETRYYKKLEEEAAAHVEEDEES